MFLYPTPEYIPTQSKWFEWMAGYGVTASQLCGRLEVELNMEILRRTIFTRRPTPTGQLLWNAIKNSKREYNIVAYRGGWGGRSSGYSCFDSDSPRVGCGTIFINLDLMIEVKKKDDSGKGSVYDLWLILLHEMGHARQFDEMPGQFSSIALGGKQKEFNELVNATRTDIIALGVVQSPVAAGKIAKSQVQRLFDDPNSIHFAYPDRIERDNYIRHEGPICDEWKLMRRGAYANILEKF